MRIFLLCLTFAIFKMSTISAQEIIDTVYYKNKYGGPEVSQKKGKVIEYTIKMPDGSICYKMTDKKGKVLQQRCFKDDIPTGIWISVAGSSVDYNVEINYDDTLYTDIPYYDLEEGKLLTELSGDFEAPVFPQNDNIFRRYVSMNLRYPEYAAINGIQGRVLSQFIIDESGKVTDYRVIESAEKVLDIEAARVIQNSPLWKPAKLNGKAIKVCIKMPTVFVLQ